MNRNPIANSSNVRSIGWHDNVMEVEFIGGGIYRYHGVSAGDHSDVVHAASVGRALRERVLGKVPSRKRPPAQGAVA